MWTLDDSDSPSASSSSSALAEWGVWVRDGAVAEESADELRAEILGCFEAGLLQQSGNKLALKDPSGARTGAALAKRNVFEADVVAEGAVQLPELLNRSPRLRQLLEDERLREALQNPWLKLHRLEQAKIQVNVGGGGAFPCHFDLPNAATATRVLTVLLYLNPAWQEGDGGEVEVLPLPFAALPLAPLHGRLVAFSSCTSLHRVRPFSGAQPRVCINFWFEGEATLPFPQPLTDESYDPRALRILRILRQQPAELRAFCKVWYSDIMVQSLRDTFDPCEELEAAIALHFEEMAAVKLRIAGSVLEIFRECLPFSPPASSRKDEDEEAEEAAELGGLFDGL
ncbi:unnamed protein product [Effrenium voratum]|uniref:Fe2OG dioxygenase domain-containing protein n=1 Tax=Effrenium voratum TaxID=2562239 RepID=A0AA36JFA9_9DINO|nr:unnamed protein product [Effrenium voratum]